MELTPPGDPSKSVLEMGAHKEMMASLKFHFGYGTVRGCGDGPLGYIDTLTVVSGAGQAYQCSVDLFNPEKDVYPYTDSSFDTVICSELIERLAADPMQMMSEINRILKPEGHVVLTTPNVGSLRSIAAILLDQHPAQAAGYTRTRHNREYVTMEIHHLIDDAGFRLVEIKPGESVDPESEWVMPILKRYNLNQEIRGDQIYALAQKSGAVKNRWPSWLYA